MMSYDIEHVRDEIARLNDFRTAKQTELERIHAETERREAQLMSQISQVDRVISGYVDLFPQLQLPRFSGRGEGIKRTQDFIVLVLTVAAGEWMTLDELVEACGEAGWTTASENPVTVVRQTIYQMEAKDEMAGIVKGEKEGLVAYCYQPI